MTSDNIIIAHLLGPDQIVPYEIAKKLFNLPVIFFMMIVQPFWSSVTHAYQKNDYEWIRNIINKLSYTWMVFSILSFVLLLLSNTAYNLWMGDKVSVPFNLSASWAIFSVLYTFHAIFSYFINGTGHLFIQMIESIFIMLLNIPLSIFLAKNCQLGLSGVIIATNLSILVYCFSGFIQYKKIINKSHGRIWYK
jgi:Na+-driven multidrug efflux pump